MDQMQGSYPKLGQQIMKESSQAVKTPFSVPVLKDLGDLGRLVHLLYGQHLSHLGK